MYFKCKNKEEKECTLVLGMDSEREPKEASASVYTGFLSEKE